jgi:hypothetical protein
MLFEDDQILLTKSENDKRYSAHKLNNTAANISVEINTEKREDYERYVLWVYRRVSRI